MMGSLSAAVTGLDSEQTAMNVIGNNLANSNTIGFKASSTNFQSLLSQEISGGSAPTATQGGTNPLAVGMGMTVASITQNMSEGGLVETGNPTDLAIQGNGMFILQGAGQDLYTRAGNFAIDSAGNLVSNATGFKVMGWSGMSGGAPTAWPPAVQNQTNLTTLTVPETFTGNGQQGTTSGVTYSLQSFSIGSDGVLTGVYEATSGASAGSTVTITLGQIALAQIPNPEGLVPVGNTDWAAGPDAATATNPIAPVPPGTAGQGLLAVGALEQSNTDVAREMTNMVTVEAAYEADTKVVSTAQQMVQALIAMKQ